MKFEAKDKIYDLKYTVNAVADLEEIAGKHLSQIMSAGEFSALRSLFWAGLITTNPGMTFNGAGEVIEAYLNEGHTFEDLMKIVNESIQQAGFLQAQTGKQKIK